MRTPSLLLLLLWLGCSSDYGDAPAGSVSQFEFSYVSPRAPEVFVFVVDDGPESLALREAMGAAWLGYDFDQWSVCAPPFDPAQHHPVDRTMVVVRPSAPEPERYWTPSDDARLRWVALQPSESDAEVFTQAGVEALLRYEAPAGQPLLLLEAYARAVDLISGRKSPRTDAEQRLLASLPEASEALVVLASARDDTSPAAPEAYAREGPPYVHSLIVRGPALQEPCYLHEPHDTRLGRWAAAPDHYVDVKSWPCEDFDVFERRLKAKCGVRCLPRSPDLDAHGRASCRVIARTDAAHCPEDLGWLDPLDAEGVRTERFDEASGQRLCEIRQLEGAALESCRHSLHCEDCEPGWCWTELSELLEAKSLCMLGPFTVYPSFRYVLGPEPSAVTITCNGG